MLSPGQVLSPSRTRPSFHSRRTSLFLSSYWQLSLLVCIVSGTVLNPGRLPEHAMELQLRAMGVGRDYPDTSERKQIQRYISTVNFAKSILAHNHDSNSSSAVTFLKCCRSCWALYQTQLHLHHYRRSRLTFELARLPTCCAEAFRPGRYLVQEAFLYRSTMLPITSVALDWESRP